MRARRFVARFGILRPLPPAQELRELTCRQRRAEVKALVLIAAEGAQELQLIVSLDAFRDHLQPQAVRERVDSALRLEIGKRLGNPPSC